MITLDPGQVVTAIVAIIGALITLVGVIWAASRARASASDANATDRIELALKAQDERIKSLESQVRTLTQDLDRARTDLDQAHTESVKSLAELRRIKKVVGDWIRLIYAEWVLMTDRPMPMLPEEDLTLLDLTNPPITSTPS